MITRDLGAVQLMHQEAIGCFLSFQEAGGCHPRVYNLRIGAGTLFQESTYLSSFYSRMAWIGDRWSNNQHARLLTENTTWMAVLFEGMAPNAAAAIICDDHRSEINSF